MQLFFAHAPEPHQVGRIPRAIYPTLMRTARTHKLLRAADPPHTVENMYGTLTFFATLEGSSVWLGDSLNFLDAG